MFAKMLPKSDAKAIIPNPYGVINFVKIGREINDIITEIMLNNK